MFLLLTSKNAIQDPISSHIGLDVDGNHGTIEIQLKRTCLLLLPLFDEFNEEEKKDTRTLPKNEMLLLKLPQHANNVEHSTI
ncbi:hypothetical protein CEXT_541181 [Caerostris extrusa]|uniref:Uncharacterized protein n=1 Tax=Caerostris extrusa TaxID=172846 RepID=A0AAV4RYK1_CAEEX|nr:hypothetical protein CEXT_541181 [Caerostris extrusa]